MCGGSPYTQFACHSSPHFPLHSCNVHVEAYLGDRGGDREDLEEQGDGVPHRAAQGAPGAAEGGASRPDGEEAGRRRDRVRRAENRPRARGPGRLPVGWEVFHSVRADLCQVCHSRVRFYYTDSHSGNYLL